MVVVVVVVVVRVIAGGYKSIVARTGLGIGNQLRREVSYCFENSLIYMDYLHENQIAKQQCSWLSLCPAKSPLLQHL